jgi:hypothetical protein
MRNCWDTIFLANRFVYRKGENQWPKKETKMGSGITVLPITENKKGSKIKGKCRAVILLASKEKPKGK